MGIKIFLVTLVDIIFGGHYLLFWCNRIRHSLTVDTLKRKSLFLISYQSKCPVQNVIGNIYL